MKSAICSVVAGLALIAPASAHHSYAMFDQAKDVALAGTVKDWQWANPHVLIVVAAPGNDGKVVEYSIEGPSPQVLRPRGWNREAMKPGDKVTVNMHPLRDGSNGGSLVSVVTADGHKYE